MSSQQTPFKFNLGDWVAMKDSLCKGQIRSRRDAIGYPNEYLFVTLHNNPPQQNWWSEDMLTPCTKPRSPRELNELMNQRRFSRRQNQEISPREAAAESAS